ncbi:MAG TPA: ankyrin repeat domain-containing protein [Gemmatimonadales bacterium]|nr:ankyrin repeat domain-containing protein [Gemmatimonadales bacterium]
MDVLPLPPRPDLAEYEKRAGELAAAAGSADPGTVRAWATEWLEALAGLLEVSITPFVQHSFDRAVASIEERVRKAGAPFTLADAQLLIARAHGFEGWPAFAAAVAPPAETDPVRREFEAAADAVVTGDLATLASLVRRHPDLVHARSSRVHGATLLHYVAANGVEDFRQKTPPNALTIARFLLEAGAEVDGLANTYGGDKYQTTMNLLVSSTHPAEAGLQAPLVHLLLDFGAAINGLDDDGSPLVTALAFGYGESADALAGRGARIDNVITAAALGRLDLVRRFVVDPATLRDGVPVQGPLWFSWPEGARAQIELALVWACRFGRAPVARFLLDQGVDPAARNGDAMTALHWAAASRCMELVKLLLAKDAPLEVRNTWGGTVLDSTVYFAVNQPMTTPCSSHDYPAVIEALLGAGADATAVTPFPTGNPKLDGVLRRYGAESDQPPEGARAS